ncbi:hypothetical protein [Pseudomonas sp. ICMP 561]|uniref:hypothetical protein n=1 Tax=Pseudomonas sp. ICMP 561 TaxID=1718918 RepID=UPI000C088F34|nr:hypothetical protein [Pseudomonas sp. ICMP 561]PHN17147.1 hypothetical protein AO242_20815 [Pseudomonas sp. ICMP 561]
MDKLPDKLPFDATKLFEALHYQLVVALEYCLKLQNGKRLWVEVYGDVTLEDVAQVEVKLYADDLRDGHSNIWNTLNNWLNKGFEHGAYESLILLTNQEFSPKSTLSAWNSCTASERFDLLKAIYDTAEKRFSKSKATEPSEGLALQRSVMDVSLEHDLMEVLEKAVFITESPSLKDKLHAFQVQHLRVVRESKLQSFIDDILGYIGSSRFIESGWEITCEDFTEKFTELTARYMKHSSIFPDVNVGSLDQKIDLNEISDRPFVRKIREIDADGDGRIKKAALQLLIANEVVDELYCDSLATPFDIQRYQKNHLDRHLDGRESAMLDCLGEECPDKLKRHSLKFFLQQHAAQVVAFKTFEDTTVDFRNGIYHMLADAKEDDESREFYWRLWSE